MNKALKLAVEKFNYREFFDCHDILEDIWFECSPSEKNFYQGLLHYAVAFHHLIDKKNPRGAKLQFKKCLNLLSSYEINHKEIDVGKIRKTSILNLRKLAEGKIRNIRIPKI